MNAAFELALVATEALAAYDEARLMPRPTVTRPALTHDEAFAAAADIRARREARGERVVGWKIGFTNRTIWDRYGVHAPIWAPVWDTTLRVVDGTRAQVPVAGLMQPRIEPEVVFRFARAPHPGMDEAMLRGCLDGVTHGVEIVQSHCDGWLFSAPDTVVDGALHGRLYVGPWQPVSAWADLGAELAATTMALACDGRIVDRGVGANVLDGPLAALRLWIDEMARRTPAWRVEPGHVVSTGTITDAWPIAAGQRWTTQPGDARLPGWTLDVVP
jgi:2-oxo-3-hexenedioate decarboxylase